MDGLKQDPKAPKDLLPRLGFDDMVSVTAGETQMASNGATDIRTLRRRIGRASGGQHALRVPGRH
jgi:hypothetical protein